MPQNAVQLNRSQFRGEVATYDLIADLIYETTRNQLVSYTSFDFRPVELPPQITDFIPRDKMSLMILWGEPGILTVKTHFDVATARFLVENHPYMPKGDVTDEKCEDFMREFSNHQCGTVRSLLQRHGINFSMSLPFLALGGDEAVFKKVRDPRAYVCAWRYTHGPHVIDCSLESYLCEPRLLEDLRSGIAKETDNQKNNVESEPGGGGLW